MESKMECARPEIHSFFTVVFRTGQAVQGFSDESAVALRGRINLALDNKDSDLDIKNIDPQNPTLFNDVVTIPIECLGDVLFHRVARFEPTHIQIERPKYDANGMVIAPSKLEITH